MNLISFQESCREKVNSTLSHTIDALPEHSARLKQAMNYALLIGGKRMRPFLIYATGDMLGVKQENTSLIRTHKHTNARSKPVFRS
mgnify:CR=1 FL=1